jgi:hypothetical protein
VFAQPAESSPAERIGERATSIAASDPDYRHRCRSIPPHPDATRLPPMYYNAPSAAIPIKLGQQHDPWNRQLNGVQPTSPGYAVYTNGVHSHQQPHHAHSMSIPSVYSQPDQLGSYRTASPNGTPGSQVIGSPHWQQQLLKAEVCFQNVSLVSLSIGR